MSIFSLRKKICIIYLDFLFFFTKHINIYTCNKYHILKTVCFTFFCMKMRQFNFITYNKFGYYAIQSFTSTNTSIIETPYLIEFGRFYLY